MDVIADLYLHLRDNIYVHSEPFVSDHTDFYDFYVGISFGGLNYTDIDLDPHDIHAADRRGSARFSGVHVGRILPQCLCYVACYLVLCPWSCCYYLDPRGMGPHQYHNEYYNDYLWAEWGDLAI